ncbi:uncharacterized protein [Dermacentor albipictus]|uniref:uncharacterized protein n=1 Tax=Dermacentor albipictus TaxID=60249 RepID=UPI0038FC1C24
MRLFSEFLLLASILVRGSRSHQPVFHAPHVVSLEPIGAAAPAWLHGSNYAHTQILPSGPNYALRRIFTHGPPVIHYPHQAPAIVTVHKTGARPLLYSGWQAPIAACVKPSTIETHVPAPVFTALAFKHPVATTKLFYTHHPHHVVTASHAQTYVPPVPIGRAIVTSYFNVPGSGVSGAPAGFPTLDTNDRTPTFSNANPQAGSVSIGDRNEDYSRRGWIKPSAPVYKSLRGVRAEDNRIRGWTGPSGPAYKPGRTPPFAGLNDQEQSSMREHPNFETPSRQVPSYPVPTTLDESSSWPASLQDDSQLAQFGSRVPRGAARRRGEGVSPGFGDRGKLRWPFEIDFDALNKQAAEEAEARNKAEKATSDRDSVESSA